jgi:hypothetical protein
VSSPYLSCTFQYVYCRQKAEKSNGSRNPAGLAGKKPFHFLLYIKSPELTAFIVKVIIEEVSSETSVGTNQTTLRNILEDRQNYMCKPAKSEAFTAVRATLLIF